MASVNNSGISRKLQAFINAVESGNVNDIKRHLSWLEIKDNETHREYCIKAIHILIEQHDFPDIIDNILQSQLFKKKKARETLISEVPHFINTAAKACQSLHQLRGFLSMLIKATNVRLADDIDILNLLDGNGWSALHLAVKDGDVKASKHLLELGSDCQQTTRDGNTALCLAIAMDNADTIPLLLPLSDVNSSDIDGDTPLMYASWSRQPNLVSQLITFGADVNAQSAHRTTALWNAVYRSCPKTVLTLLQNNAKMDVKSEGTRPFRQDDDEDNSDISSQQVVKIYRGHKRSLLWVAADRIIDTRTYDKSMQILLTLLEAGYDVTKDEWLSNISGNVPKKYPRGFTENGPLRDVLYFFHTRPRKLKDICRGFIRNYHAEYLKGSFSDWLSNMNVGETVKDFLTLKYIPLE